MTINYKLDATYELRKFLWTKLQAAGIFDPEDYYSDNLQETVIPILPIQQSPEMNQFYSGKKHIVYDKIGVSYEDLWAICNEQVIFTIYAIDVDEINEIRNYFIDEFRRMDESARDINRWSQVSNKFKFYSIYISEMSPTGPSQEMQGMMSADIILEVKYSRHTDTSGRFV
jgi:hypothetical protein